MRKKSKRSEDKKKPNQNRMHSRLLRELNSRSKHKEKKTAANVTLPHALPFQTRHSTKKTMKHALESLPNSSRKKMFVIVKMAIKAGIEIKGNLRKKFSYKSLIDEHCKIIQDFYLKDGISWQAPGQKNRIILRENINGKKEKQICK